MVLTIELDVCIVVFYVIGGLSRAIRWGCFRAVNRHEGKPPFLTPMPKR